MVVGKVSFDVVEEESTWPQAPPGSAEFPELPENYEPPARFRLVDDEDDVIETPCISAMKALRASAVMEAQKSQPSVPDEKEQKSQPSAPVEEEQKSRPVQMTQIEDGQRKFEEFNTGGGKDYRPDIPPFKKDDRGDKTIP